MHPTMLTHDDALTAAEKAREREADLAGIDAMLELEDTLTAAIYEAHGLVGDGWADIARARDHLHAAKEIVQQRRRAVERLMP